MTQLSRRLTRAMPWQEVVPIGLIWLVACTVIWWFAVDMPVGDQWGEAGILIAAREGRLTFGELLRQANESRPFFPRLIWLALSAVGNWNTRSQIFVTPVVLALASIGAWVIARATLEGATRRFVIIASTLLLFTLAQWDNLFWGIQSIVCMPTLCLLGGLALIVSRPLTTGTIAAVCALGTVSTFSYTNGMLCWPLLAIAVAFAPAGSRSGRIRGIAAIAVCAAVAIAIYFHGYHTPAGHPSFAVGLTRPLDFLAAFLSYVGAPLAIEPRRWPTAVIIGTLVCLLLAGAVFVVLRAWRETRFVGRAMPWLLMSAYGFGTGLITTLGRLGFGREYLLAPRYVAFSSVLLVGLVGLIAVCFNRAWRPRDDAPHRADGERLRVFAGGVALATAVMGLYVLNAVDSFAQVQRVHSDRLHGRAVLRFLDVAEENNIRLYVHWPGPDVVRQMLPRLFATGLLMPTPREVTWERPSTDRVGVVEGVHPVTDAPGMYRASGWGYLWDRGRVADAILVTDERQSPRRVLHVVVPEISRDDTVTLFRTPAATFSGWTMTFAAEGRTPTLGFWAYDGVRGRARALCPNPSACGAFEGVVNGNLIERRASSSPR
jgi:hypothetical protein